MAEFQIKGWCPTAHRPMLAGDGLIVRIRPRMARLTQAQARGIAAAASTHGNGLIDLSTRGNIQLRGIRDGSHQPLLADLTALELVDRDMETETRRNIHVTPFWMQGDGTADLLDKIENSLSQANDIPSKFGIAIDTGLAPALTRISGDVRVERSWAGLIMRPDGAAFGQRIDRDTIAQSIADLQSWFLKTGGVDHGRGRMAAHIARVGLPDGFDIPAAKPAEVTVPGRHALGFLIGFEFGQMHSSTLAALATRPLRITPWRMILLEGAETAPVFPGMITNPDDPRLRVSACTGAPTCPQALQPTRALAARLAEYVPVGQHLHVSGCGKGCAHPAPADLTLTATASGFNVTQNGRAGGSPHGIYDPSRSIFKAI